jgi:moderate conductance mechanosensitive channel
VIASLLDNQPEWSEIAFVLSFALVLAYAAARGAGRFANWLLTAVHGHTRRSEADHLELRKSVRSVRWAVFFVAYAVIALPLLDAIGKRLDAGFTRQTLVSWLLSSGLRIAIISLVAYLVIRIVATSTRRMESDIALETGPAHVERLKRAQTLGRLIQNVVRIVVSAIALLMILRELDVDIMPMLTGAGIAGVALGFGAQWLVRDLIAGFFLILEDQVRIGDSVAINGIGGSVEAINLRTIALRDVEGTVHVFQNGAINTLANRTRDYAYYVIDLTVSFQDDTDRIITIVQDTANAMRTEPPYDAMIMEPLEVLGVDSFQNGLVTIRTRIKTLPQKQWEVGRELRRRLRYALTKAGIDLPLSGVTVAPERMRSRAAGTEP